MYDRLIVTINIKRTIMYYLFRVYIPTSVLMVFNFGSYWIPASAVPARATIIVTTMLANAVILQSVTEEIVKVSYTTPMQLFLLVNALFIMVAIIEFIIVLMVIRTYNKVNMIPVLFVS